MLQLVRGGASSTMLMTLLGVHKTGLLESWTESLTLLPPGRAPLCCLSEGQGLAPPHPREGRDPTRTLPVLLPVMGRANYTQPLSILEVPGPSSL